MSKNGQCLLPPASTLRHMPATTLPDHEIYQRARLARDWRFDGLFFTAVRSTGIYCRPICPAPPAKRSNVEYYPCAASASAAGFRPCLRCRPELSPQAMRHSGEESVRCALALIADGMLQSQPVAALAKQLGVSTRQLQRQFLRQLGATPAQIHRTSRLLFAKQLLTETNLPVTEVALASGFNSVRRFNRVFQQDCAMPPTALRRQQVGRRKGELVLRLGYRPPLDFTAMLAFLQRRAITGIERIDANSYARAIGPPQCSTLIHVSHAPQRPELLLRITSTEPGHIADIVRRVRRLFDLDADLHAVHTTLCQDPLLAEAISRHPGLRMPGSWDGFETAVRAILGQQVSVAAASTLAQRLVERHGDRRQGMPAGLDRAFPSPEQLHETALEEIGLPRRRAATIRALANACIDGHLQFSSGQRLSDFVDHCIALPGIGQWSAHYIAMRALSQPDAFPAGDLVLQHTLGAPGRLTERATELRSQAWRPWRSYATAHLWQLAADHQDNRQ
jgi:AraC family transcriptional regulator of adaptative response / DNA-3-methyladenine glycosylase II